MGIYRKWYCTCSGMPREMVPAENAEDEPLEVICARCGATPSSDPQRTVVHRDIEDWED